MAEIKISIFNDSTALTDAQVQGIVGALQTQISEHFAPAWGVDADLNFVPKGESPPAGTWWLSFLDDSDQAGALGYHDLTSDGLPIGKVFAKTDLDNHLSWSITASHELLEMLGDPDINRTAFVQTSETEGQLYAYEVCDAVEDDQFGYAINGVTVSDFVLPSYFEPDLSKHMAHVKYDYCGHLRSAVPNLLSGGYIGSFQVSGGSGWKQLTAPTEGQPHRGHLKMNIPSGRSDRRKRARASWRHSEPRLVPIGP